METYLLIFGILIICSIVYLKIANKFNIIDKPNERSSHSKITIRGGGILFPLSIIIFFFLNGFQYPYFTLAVFLIAIISFLDDIYTLPSKIRFPIQFLAMVLVLVEVGLSVTLWYVYFPILIVGLAVINFFNFMDGINGITGFNGLACLLGVFLINQNELLINPDLLLFLVLSILVFGYYNFRKKALFFAGDIGSITLGLTIVFFTTLLYDKLQAPLVWLLVMCFGSDGTLTLLYRKIYTNESVFDPHRHHIYQKLVHQKKWSHLKVSFIYGLLQVGCSLFVYFTYQLPFDLQWTILSIWTFAIGVSYVLLFRWIASSSIEE